MRYFIATSLAYEQARAALDVAFGFPSPGTETAIPPVSQLPVAADGRVAVPIDERLVELPPAEAIVAALFADDQAGEITESEFVSICASYYPTPTPPGV